jgi:helix-hairpin-helix protein
MRLVRVTAVCVLTLVMPAAASAQRSSQPQPQEEIHYLGKVNINEAPADELERVPGLSKADVERIVAAREAGPISNLKPLKLPAKALKYLRTEGASDFARIKKLPLQAIEGSPAPHTAIPDSDIAS